MRLQAREEGILGGGYQWLWTSSKSMSSGRRRLDSRKHFPQHGEGDEPGERLRQEEEDSAPVLRNSPLEWVGEGTGPGGHFW